jgi:GntR family phosphonate transport system transcriptional regulator
MMPLYLKIASVLHDEVCNKYMPGEYLPAEHVLADRFRVNRHTLRRALDMLVEDGLIIRQQGIGNQVAKPKVAYVLNDHASYTHNLDEVGLKPETSVLVCHDERLSQVIAKQIGYCAGQTVAGQPVTRLTTLRHINGCAACLIDHYLFGLDSTRMNRFRQGSLHRFLFREFALTLRRHTTHLRARMPSIKECEYLKMGPDRPVFEVRTHNVDINTNELKEYSVAIGRSDFFEYKMAH